MKTQYTGILAIMFLGAVLGLQAQKESDFYKIVDVPIPDDVLLEVGGLAFNDADQLGVTTRRGELWLIDRPYSQNPAYTKYAQGLHEPLGLNFRDGSFYTAQRGELTQLTDRDGNGKADVYKTIYSWPLSGNYHEYSYGPKFLENGNMLLTLNLSWVGHGASLAKWRGWLVEISQMGSYCPSPLDCVRLRAFKSVPRARCSIPKTKGIG